MSEQSRGSAGARTEPECEELRAELSDEQWLLIADLFANPKEGHPMARFVGALWTLRSGARLEGPAALLPFVVHRLA